MFHFEFFIESVQHCAHILELRDQEFPSLETLQLDSNDEICINKLLDAIWFAYLALKMFEDEETYS